MRANVETLLSNASATGSAVQFPGGKAMFILNGTIGGASIALEKLSIDGSSYVTVGTALTAAGTASFDLPPGTYRASVTGGTPSGLYASLESAGE